MRLRDLSVRKKLILSNAMMVVIPVFIIIAILSSIVLGFFILAGGNGPSGLLMSSNGTISNYQLQLAFDSLCSAINDKNSLKGDRKLSDTCSELEQAGAEILIGSGSDVVYRTNGAAAEELISSARGISGGSAKGTLFYRSGSGLVYQTEVPNKDGKPVHLLVVSKQLADGGAPGGFLNSVERYVKLGAVLAGGFAVIVILLTGIILAEILSKQIVTPISRLRKAANEIQNGNLENAVEASSGDELGQVCKDFDSMRLRLKESVQLQQKYEEGRKELIAGISHDLSTPLTSIKGYVSGLMDGIANTPEKQEHYLHTIYDTACDMDKLVDSLFWFSKLDLGRVSFEMESVCLTEYFQDYCEQMRPRLNEQDMHLIFSDYCKETAKVKIDRLQFSRVLSNLIDNSVKYKQPGRGKIEIALYNTGKEVEIEFSDDGSGIDEKDADKIFDSFYRADPARSSAVKGSGLGLAIVKQIVERMGGTVRARGHADRGLTISIKLPKAEGDEK